MTLIRREEPRTEKGLRIAKNLKKEWNDLIRAGKKLLTFLFIYSLYVLETTVCTVQKHHQSKEVLNKIAFLYFHGATTAFADSVLKNKTV